MAGNQSVGIEITLPIGIIGEDGTRYHRVIADSMCGLDEENMADPAVRDNASKANTALIRRLIQEIPGLLPRKTNRYDFVDENLVTKMYQADRDTIIIAVLGAASRATTQLGGACPHCERLLPVLNVDLPSLEFTVWPDESPLYFDIELPGGIEEAGVIHTKGTMRFPTARDMEELGSVDANPAVAQTRLFFRCLNMNTEHFILVSQHIQRLSRKDRAYLNHMAISHTPGYQTTITTVCPNCHKTAKRSVDIGAFFDSMNDFSEA